MARVICCVECKSTIFPNGQVFLHQEKMYCGICAMKIPNKKESSEDEKIDAEDVFDLVFKAHSFLSIAKQKVNQKLKFILGPETRPDLEEILKEIDALYDGFINLLNTRNKNELIDLSTKMMKIVLHIDKIC